ncbi:MAG: PspC domain-containing protein [Cyclobacteriaceae bacterium]|nr:PspC domain-containing protein [Cyclobacteriaceae bacterium]
MKKNISINISGIIFHIEEDGYETLRKYLDSIKRYFASFEDSSEILSDIESRIAEIFLAKLHEGKQVITAEDVSSLVATMGSVSDFKAAEEQEFAGESAKSESSQQSQSSGTQTANKKLQRDQKRKILGGVCAGLAHYFNIDPVWPRLLFALLVLGSYGGLLLVYIIFWIVLPGSDNLEEEASVKKMYRDTEKKVIGGVAGGVAAFFGVDVTVIRVLFVVFSFVGGLGLLTYIILWIALPEAKTITERMQMQGEPVTLTNIESTVKKSLNEKDQPEESVLAKIILFPFRLIAMVIEGITKVLGPLFTVFIDVLRVAIGIVISLTGLSMIIALVMAASIIIGIFSFSDLPWLHFPVGETGIPLDAIRNAFPHWTVFFGFAVAFVPALFITLIGSSIIAKRIIFNQLVGWSLFVLFFVSVIALSISIPQMIYAFKEEGEYKVEKTFDLNGKVPILRINEIGLDDYDVTDLNIKGYEGTDLKLIERFEAQGNTRKVAGENAQLIEYKVEQRDSILLFDSNITFKKGAPFRAQRLKMDLYIPYNTLFVIEERMWHIIQNNSRDYEGYRDSNFNHTWRMTDRGFECTTCQEPTGRKSMRLRDQYGLRDFNKLELSGLFDVQIEQGNDYAVEMDGDEKQKKRYDIYKSGDLLVIDFDDDRDSFWDKAIFDNEKVKIKITMPGLQKLKARGAGNLSFNGFDEHDLDIELLGAVSGQGNINANNLTVELKGVSNLELKGSGHFLDAKAVGASSLRAYGYRVIDAVVDAIGASSIKVYVSDKLEITKTMTSSVSHRGDPEVIKRN